MKFQTKNGKSDWKSHESVRQSYQGETEGKETFAIKYLQISLHYIIWEITTPFHDKTERYLGLKFASQKEHLILSDRDQWVHHFALAQEATAVRGR